MAGRNSSALPLTLEPDAVSQQRSSKDPDETRPVPLFTPPPLGALVHALRHTFATRVVASDGAAVKRLYRTIAQLPEVAR